jgi:hypothetical protein
LSNNWNELKLGDKIRITHWPSELIRDNCLPETRELYDWLIVSSSVLTISRMEIGMPMAEVIRDIRGVTTWEYIGINHGGWARVDE